MLWIAPWCSGYRRSETLGFAKDGFTFSDSCVSPKPWTSIRRTFLIVSKVSSRVRQLAKPYLQLQTETICSSHPLIMKLLVSSHTPTAQWWRWQIAGATTWRSQSSVASSSHLSHLREPSHPPRYPSPLLPFFFLQLSPSCYSCHPSPLSSYLASANCFSDSFSCWCCF